MMILTYHFRNPDLRDKINLREISSDIKGAVESFKPLVALKEITKNSYTIKVYTDYKPLKDRIVRSLGHAIAVKSLKNYVGHKANTHALFFEKKPIIEEYENEPQIKSEYIYEVKKQMFTKQIEGNLYNNMGEIIQFPNREELKEFLIHTIHFIIIQCGHDGGDKYSINDLKLIYDDLNNWDKSTIYEKIEQAVDCLLNLADESNDSYGYSYKMVPFYDKREMQLMAENMRQKKTMYKKSFYTSPLDHIANYLQFPFEKYITLTIRRKRNGEDQFNKCLFWNTYLK